MTTMDDQKKSECQKKCQDLRAELKTWENTWAKENSGKKPGREDIKRHPDIAHKYKRYQKYRDIIDGKVPPPTKEQPKPNKRKSQDAAPSQTPLKRLKHAETPSKGHFYDEKLEETPTISRKLFSPAAVTSLGPTPQRDGRVLGLFDVLEEKNAGTPSKKLDGAAKESDIKVEATPSKRTSASDVETTPRMGRTPMSASKRQYLNNFMSPLKSRDGNVGAKTPSKLHFDTPQFLKRHSLATVDENGQFDAPAPLRLPRKPLGKGLSDIVASLRKVEEEQADEDLEALREVEAEEMGYSRPQPKPTADEDVLVKDSQARQLPLGGFDDEALYDSLVEEDKGPGDNPPRVFKKKGQKRTTRKVNIRPTWTKRPTTTVEKDSSDYEEDEQAIPRTQLGDLPVDGDGENPGSDSEFENDEKATKKCKKRTNGDKKHKEGPVKKATRKVNELAHANFQRLKLRQNGAKGGPGYNSRFRRRR